MTLFQSRTESSCVYERSKKRKRDRVFEFQCYFLRCEAKKGKIGRSVKGGWTYQPVDSVILDKDLVEAADRRKEDDRVHVVEERHPRSCYPFIE